MLSRLLCKLHKFKKDLFIKININKNYGSMHWLRYCKIVNVSNYLYLLESLNNIKINQFIFYFLPVIKSLHTFPMEQFTFSISLLNLIIYKALKNKKANCHSWWNWICIMKRLLVKVAITLRATWQMHSSRCNDSPTDSSWRYPF